MFYTFMHGLKRWSTIGVCLMHQRAIYIFYLMHFFSDDYRCAYLYCAKREPILKKKGTHKYATSYN